MSINNRTFRVFVSSTFSDLKEERNALQKEVFPELQKLCLQKGFNFQAIDLRWGVNQEATLDHKTMDICLKEIERCQAVSPRPNFIVLLGDKYGWQPLPTKINSDEFEYILDSVKGLRSRALLESWYKKDNNAQYEKSSQILPGVYCLAPRTGEKSHFSSEDQWRRIESRIGRILRSIVNRSPNISGVERDKYFQSATEQEIHKGALKVQDASDHVFCFFRDIDYSSATIDSQMVKYLDQAENKKKIQNLKGGVLQNHLNGKNLFRYQASYKDGQVSKGHIEQLCEQVYENLESVILEEISAFSEIDKREEELLAHKARHEELILERLVGQNQVLMNIENYLNRPEGKPLLVIGETGSGKSTILAHAASEHIARKNDTVIVQRYIGSTPESMNAMELLEGINFQIETEFPGQNVGSNQIDDQFIRFSRNLRLSSSKKQLLLVVDGIERLASKDILRIFNILRNGLPVTSKVLISMDIFDERVESGDYTKIFKTEHIPKLKVNDAKEILESFLAVKGRLLTGNQEQLLLDSFSQTGNPLLLRNYCEIASEWKSFESILPSILPLNLRSFVEDSLKQLIDQRKHLPCLLLKVIQYLSISRHGFSESELWDMVSRDPEVYAEFLESSYHLPADFHDALLTKYGLQSNELEFFINCFQDDDKNVNRDFFVETLQEVLKDSKTVKLPIVLWTRLLADIEWMFVTLNSDGMLLLQFRHSIFKAILRDLFVNSDNCIKLHREVCDYFEEMSSNHSLEELPYHLEQAKSFEKLETLLLSFGYLANRIAKTRLSGLISDFQSALNSIPSNGMGCWLKFIEEHSQGLRMFPTQFPSYVLNEGDESLRATAEQYLAEEKGMSNYFRIYSHKLPDISGNREGDQAVNLINRLDLNGYARYSAIASEVQRGYYTTRRGFLGACSLIKNEELPVSIPLPKGDMKAVYVSPDGLKLCLIFKGGRGKVLFLKFDDAENLVSCEEAHSFNILYSRTLLPYVKMQNDALVFQSSDGNIIKCRFSSWTNEVLDVPGIQDKFLSFFSEEIFVMVDSYSAKVFCSAEKGEAKHIDLNCRVTAAARDSEHIFLATSDLRILAVSLNDLEIDFEETIEETVLAVVPFQNTLVTYDNRRNINRYTLQDFGRTSFPTDTNIPLDARYIELLDKNCLAIISGERAVAFNFCDNSQKGNKTDVYKLFPDYKGNSFLAVRGTGNILRHLPTEDDEYIYVSRKKKDIVVDNNIKAVRSFNYNKVTGKFVTYYASGECYVADTETEAIEKFSGLPKECASVVIDDQGTLWLISPGGQIFSFQDGFSSCIDFDQTYFFGDPKITYLKGHIPGEEYLFVFTNMKEVDNSKAPDFNITFLLFKLTERRGKKTAMQIGKRIFPVGSGVLEGMCFSDDHSSLHVRIGHYFYSGTIEQFFSGNEKKQLFERKDISFQDIALSNHQEYIIAASRSGEIYILDGSNYKILDGYLCPDSIKSIIPSADNNFISLSSTFEIQEIQYLRRQK